MNYLKKNLSLILLIIKNLKDKIYMKIFCLKTKKVGLDLVAEISPEQNGFDPKEVKRCTHSNTPYLRESLKSLNISNKDSVIDIGCSKGGALLCMNEFPFKKIDGIEISENLTNIAKNNCSILGLTNIGIYNCNALNYKNYNKYNIFYFYNSLFPKVLKEVLETILRIAKGKEIFFIYNNPKYSYIFEELSLFLIKDLEGNWDHRIYIYSNFKRPQRFT